jgi:hypothetical protein
METKKVIKQFIRGGAWPTAALFLSAIVMSGWYVNCDSFDQLPVRAYKGTLWEISCTGGGEEYANLAYFEVRDCAEDLGLLVTDWEKSQMDLRFCEVEAPFRCPGLSWTVAECAGVVAGGEGFVLVSKSWPTGTYDYRWHVRLGMLNMLVWTGQILVPGTSEGEIRETEEYWQLVDCLGGLR